jgi:hypothetical protein
MLTLWVVLTQKGILLTSNQLTGMSVESRWLSCPSHRAQGIVSPFELAAMAWLIRLSWNSLCLSAFCSLCLLLLTFCVRLVKWWIKVLKCEFICFPQSACRLCQQLYLLASWALILTGANIQDTCQEGESVWHAPLTGASRAPQLHVKFP